MCLVPLMIILMMHYLNIISSGGWIDVIHAFIDSTITSGTVPA